MNINESAKPLVPLSFGTSFTSSRYCFFPQIEYKLMLIIPFQEAEMSAEQQVFQVAMSAVQESEEEVVELHGQYFGHRDTMDKMLIPLYQMTNEIDYDVDGK